MAPLAPATKTFMASSLEPIHHEISARTTPELNSAPAPRPTPMTVVRRLTQQHYTFTPFSMYHGVVPLNLKNPEVERLAAEVARLTGESKTEAIRRALEERRARLKGTSSANRRAKVLRFLRRSVWPSIPKQQLGRRLTREEEDALLGYGPEGV